MKKLINMAIVWGCVFANESWGVVFLDGDYEDTKSSNPFIFKPIDPNIFPDRPVIKGLSNGSHVSLYLSPSSLPSALDVPRSLLIPPPLPLEEKK